MKTNEITINVPVKETKIAKRPKRKVRKIWKLIALAIVVISAISIIDANFERISPVASKQLMYGVEDGERWAVEKFNKYIERDIYLFDGPISIEAMCNKYNLDYDIVYSDFVASDYESLQEYFDDVVKPTV